MAKAVSKIRSAAQQMANAYLFVPTVPPENIASKDPVFPIHAPPSNAKMARSAKMASA
jgi:hypothetical protein